MINRSSLDAFALTNPAFCSLVLNSFVSGYEEQDPDGMELALAYLALPCTMTNSLAATFHSTNAVTGLLKWVARSPEIRLEIDRTIEETAALTRAGLVFGLQRRVLILDRQRGRLRADTAQLTRAPREAPGARITTRPYTIARRLGGWCGGVGSAKTIFTLLGVT
jgi:hypothetical protein